MLAKRLADPTLPPVERAFLDALAPAFTELADTAEDTLYVDGAARLVHEHRLQDLEQINELMSALGSRDVLVRIGAEHERPELRSFSLVASAYGLPSRSLGTVSLMGPVRMDYGEAIGAVREAAHQLSRYIETVYDES
jgi:heat-inducible transcriptional repressor